MSYPLDIGRRHWLARAGTMLASTALPLQLLAAQQTSAVPYYNAGVLLQMLRRHWYLPSVAVFRAQAEALEKTLSSPCTAAQRQTARTGWQETMAAWTRLSAVATGPLLQRRSERAIDFQPPRPRLIDQAIDALRVGNAQGEGRPLPPSAEQMVLIGTPAKGLPALELLLWGAAYAQANETTCAYAAALAADLVHEARALQSAWQAEDEAELSEEDQTAAFAEFVNQWLGAIETLRWRDIERPLRAGHGDKTGYPRQLSGQTALAWRSHWEAVRTLTLTPAAPPAAGEGLVPMALYLRGQGYMKVADALDAGTRKVDHAMKSLRPRDNPLRLQAAVLALSELKHLIETDAATAAQVHIGFSDADGD